MGKKDKKVNEKIAGEDNSSPATGESSAAAPEAKKEAAARTRGPRGVAETAVITLLATANPKRTGSKAERAFSNYKSGMTIKEFADALDADAELKGTSTGHLVYDAKHGFISIDGYDPGAIVQPKPKAEPKAKKEKAAPKEKTPGDVEQQAEAGEEQMA